MKTTENRLKNDPKWAVRGLLRIYREQLDSEKFTGIPVEVNNVGFTRLDVSILTSFALRCKTGRGLSKAQYAILFKLIPKYAANSCMN